MNLVLRFAVLSILSFPIAITLRSGVERERLTRQIEAGRVTALDEALQGASVRASRHRKN